MFICGAEVYAIFFFFFMIKATCSPYYQEAKFIRSQAHCHGVRVPTGAPSAHVNRSLGSAVPGTGRGRGLPRAPTGGARLVLEGVGLPFFPPHRAGRCEVQSEPVGN